MEYHSILIILIYFTFVKFFIEYGEMREIYSRFFLRSTLMLFLKNIVKKQQKPVRRVFFPLAGFLVFVHYMLLTAPSILFKAFSRTERGQAIFILIKPSPWVPNQYPSSSAILAL